MIGLAPSPTRILMTLVAVVATTSGCKPWTVRPLDDSAPRAASFDARAYVESIWNARVLPASETAVDVATLLDRSATAATSGTAPARRNVLVKGRTRITSIDLRSRVGLAFIDVGTGASTRVALQVGPVLRGTALRDALPFIQFTDFVNQIDHAAVASELNERALQSAIGRTAPESLEGKTVSFRGAATTVTRSGLPDVIEIVPVVLQIEGTKP
jgi:predicted lipoprotein